MITVHKKTTNEPIKISTNSLIEIGTDNGKTFVKFHPYFSEKLILTEHTVEDYEVIKSMVIEEVRQHRKKEYAFYENRDETKKKNNRLVLVSFFILLVSAVIYFTLKSFLF